MNKLDSKEKLLMVSSPLVILDSELMMYSIFLWPTSHWWTGQDWGPDSLTPSCSSHTIWTQADAEVSTLSSSSSKHEGSSQPSFLWTSNLKAKTTTSEWRKSLEKIYRRGAILSSLASKFRKSEDFAIQNTQDTRSYNTHWDQNAEVINFYS